jgi:two-component system, OmpR family, copper resistance phosphate regulon response regulator CusR
MQPYSPRILSMDDNSDSCELIRLMLQNSNADYRITSVLTSSEALSLAAIERFDLYILDYRLKGINGIEVCHTLRRTDTDTPIIFFTAEAHGRERQEAMQAGADAYLVKPNDLKNLTETVKRLLARSHTCRRHMGRTAENPHASL